MLDQVEKDFSEAMTLLPSRDEGGEWAKDDIDPETGKLIDPETGKLIDPDDAGSGGGGKNPMLFRGSCT